MAQIHTAVVTGASGFVASELCHQLLSAGWNVRGTVRSKAKGEHLVKLADALPGTLSLHEADLGNPGAFDDVVKGADYVFHVASTFKIHGIKDRQKELIEPALEGTRNVLGSVVKAKADIKRVVLTSSVAAVFRQESPPKNGKTFGPEDWNTEANLDSDDNAAYCRSKVVAEEAAWELAKEHGLDLVTINPSEVIGPVISSRGDATSVQLIQGLLENNPEIPNYPVVCDVRDVARAHIAAAVTKSASGRYIISWPDTVSEGDIVEVLAGRFPDVKLPSKEKQPSKEFFDISKMKELIGDPTPWQSSFVDMATTLIQRGVVKPASK